MVTSFHPSSGEVSISWSWPMTLRREIKCPDCEGSPRWDSVACRRCNGTGRLPYPGPFLIDVTADIPGAVTLRQLLQAWAAEPARTECLAAIHDLLEEEGHCEASAALRPILAKDGAPTWLWQTMGQRHGPGMHTWREVLTDAFGDFMRLAGAPKKKQLRPCPKCQGTGDKNLRHFDDWWLCEDCKGTGELPAAAVAYATLAEVEYFLGASGSAVGPRAGNRPDARG
jgi:hypothetical protein